MKVFMKPDDLRVVRQDHHESTEFAKNTFDSGAPFFYRLFIERVFYKGILQRSSPYFHNLRKKGRATRRLNDLEAGLGDGKDKEILFLSIPLPSNLFIPETKGEVLIHPPRTPELEDSDDPNIISLFPEDDGINREEFSFGLGSEETRAAADLISKLTSSRLNLVSTSSGPPAEEFDDDEADENSNIPEKVCDIEEDDLDLDMEDEQEPPNNLERLLGSSLFISIGSSGSLNLLLTEEQKNGHWTPKYLFNQALLDLALRNEGCLRHPYFWDPTVYKKVTRLCKYLKRTYRIIKRREDKERQLALMAKEASKEDAMEPNNNEFLVPQEGSKEVRVNDDLEAIIIV